MTGKGKLDRKHKVELVLRRLRKTTNGNFARAQFCLRLERELENLCEPEARMPRFNTLLGAIWVAASNDQT